MEPSFFPLNWSTNPKRLGNSTQLHCTDREHTINPVFLVSFAGPRLIALLVHDFLWEGRCWIANLPSNSLGFFLAYAGYDVWIINTRGTTWSRRHKQFSIYQQEFWNFSFHEMAVYDIPATINFILHKTKQDSLYYIGHSQGAGIGKLRI
ncbi:putative lipase [Crotalus adamanteus]|uniref:Lipase n=1 Tax=Crotalus adamanteus TaxID=8729 RepID=A0AAW1BFJ5_CROAD